MEYANVAYKTAGLSANEYMSMATSFSASLLQSLATDTAALSDEAVEAATEAYESQYDSLEDSLDAQRDLLEESHDKEIRAFEELTEQKIDLIDKQYKENLKLIDEEKYNKLKAIDEQIAALDSQTKAEKEAIEKREQEKKKAILQEKIDTAKTEEAKKQAEQDLADYLADLTQKNREKQRKEQIEALKEQKASINEEANAKKAVLKEQRDAEIEVVKETSDVKLKEIKKTQDKELESLKKANKAKLAEMKDYIDKQTKMLTKSSSAAVYSAETYAKAADAANQAIIDMSDNANKMGTNMEAIQNAYQGFAKQNYTMLDNLKLGYGGTKEEMQRLLADAEKLTGKKYDLSNLNDIFEAIHVIQVELGIAGTTAIEAEGTLSGSISSMQASWSNLITGMADENADLEELVNNFVDSVGIVAENLLPRVEIALEGVGSLIEELLPIIVARIPEIVDTVLPDLLESGVNMLLIICQGIIDTLPSLGVTAFELIEKLVSGITDNAGAVFNSGSETLLGFMEGIADAIPDLLNMIADAIVSMALAITEPNTLNNIIEAGIELILGLVEGITEALPQLLAAAPTILANLATAIITSIPRLLIAATEIVFRLAGFLIDALVQWKNLGNNFFEALKKSFGKVDWMSLGINIIDGIWYGLRDGWDWLVGKVENLADDLFGAACDILGIHSPSKKFEWIADMCLTGFDKPMEDFNPYDTLQNSMKANTAGLQATFTRTALATAGGPAIDYAMMGDGIKSAISGLGMYISGERVGEIITPTVNSELVSYEVRRT